MAITDKQRVDLNNSMVAAQSISLGDIINNLGDLAYTSASSLVTSSSSISGLGTMATQSASAVVITGGSIVAEYARFGNSEGYATFEEDGTLVFSGSATVWDDIFFPLVTAKQGQTDKPGLCGESNANQRRRERTD
jgi:hypothetical protein